MTYQEILDYLFSQLPIYQRDGPQAYKKDIGNIIRASKTIGNPHLKFKSIHIAGTNGKGSTSHFIASIFKKSGYKVGLYTSPHLKDFRERIMLNNDLIPEEYVINFVMKNKQLFEQLSMSFFEMTVLLAFDFFSESNVDIAIIEVGLGGRLDSTNIIYPEISVITNISLDHTNLLGSEIKKIAEEKAGIIKPNTPVVIGRKQKEIMHIFDKIAKEKKSNIIYSKKEYINNAYTDYQQENINTSICAINELNKLGWKISIKNIQEGIQYCMEKKIFKGRWHMINNKPLTICDTAHNIDGIKEIIKEINKIKYKHLHFVVGMVNDKKIDDILNLLPKNATYYFCKADIERSLNEKILQKKAKKYMLLGRTYSNVKSALNAAKYNSNENDLIFIGGSTFIVAEIV